MKEKLERELVLNVQENLDQLEVSKLQVMKEKEQEETHQTTNLLKEKIADLESEVQHEQTKNQLMKKRLSKLATSYQALHWSSKLSISIEQSKTFDEDYNVLS